MLHFESVQSSMDLGDHRADGGQSGTIGTDTSPLLTGKEALDSRDPRRPEEIGFDQGLSFDGGNRLGDGNPIGEQSGEHRLLERDRSFPIDGDLEHESIRLRGL